SLETTENYYEKSMMMNDDDFQPCSNVNLMAFSQVFIPTLYSIIFIVGVIGNGLVVFTLVKSKKYNIIDMCLLNLAVSDLLFLISLPFWAHHAAISKWTMGNIMCHAVTALYMLGFYGSIFFMVLMTVDRYAIIIHTQASLFTNHRSVKAGIALSLFIWVLSLGASLPTIIFSQTKNESGEWTCKPEYPHGAWRQFSYIELNILGWVLPLSVMVFCYSRIIPILRSIKSQRKHKAVRLILVLVAVFFLFWTPYNLVIFMHFLHYSGYMQNCEWKKGLDMAMQWVETIAFSHCCINPIIYGFTGQRFRTLLFKTLNHCFPNRFGYNVKWVSL
ncbi:C-C chemokine receptor type 5-like, partial [Trichomycterus rosablanca]|uniref:C-C chemokine receptor type 5-like n=1 Tax=Trichomycterus rosablanca TaxID=2290929 RepID=UPI002F354B99